MGQRYCSRSDGSGQDTVRRGGYGGSEEYGKPKGYGRSVGREERYGRSAEKREDVIREGYRLPERCG